MAHRILGIDVGAYSVKVAVVAAGLRQTNVVDMHDFPIPPAVGDDVSTEERGIRALAALVASQGMAHDVPFWAVSGNQISMRVLEFGFSGLKRSDLDRAVGGELEQILPHDLEDIVYDFDTIPKDVPADGAAAPPGTRLLTVASARERIRALLELIAAHQLDARGLIAAPVCYGRVLERLGVPSVEPVMVIDVGHTRTNLCLVTKNRPAFARTLSRGGKNVTAAIAKAWSLTWDQAEQAKHSDGFVASRREPAQSPAWQRISDVLVGEIAPLAREVRQTLVACRTQTGVDPRRILLCGGGARLRGLASYLSEELELPAEPLVNGSDARVVGEAGAARNLAADTAIVALAVALEGGSGRPAFDLRRGEFAYRADFSFLRQRAGFLAAAVLLIVAFAAANAYASLYRLRKDEKVLDDRLRIATTEVFGEPLLPEEVEEKITPHTEESPLPKATAFDQLVEISKRLPPRDKLQVEVAELDIKKEKVVFKATTDSAASIETIQRSLKEIACFEDVQGGKVQSGNNDQKVFTLTITTKCM